MLDEKDLQAIDEIFAHRMNVILESAIMISYLPVDSNRRYPQISTGRFVHYVSTDRF